MGGIYLTALGIKKCLLLYAHICAQVNITSLHSATGAGGFLMYGKRKRRADYKKLPNSKI